MGFNGSRSRLKLCRYPLKHWLLSKGGTEIPGATKSLLAECCIPRLPVLDKHHHWIRGTIGWNLLLSYRLKLVDVTLEFKISSRP